MKNKTLPLINSFLNPYIIWNEKEATHEEKMNFYNQYGYVKDKIPTTIKKKIDTSLKSAHHIAKVGVDNALGNFIDAFLDRNVNYKKWRENMPSITPKDLVNFQKYYPDFSIKNVDFEINKIGCTLIEEQCLFHGGFWDDARGDEFITSKPFSSTFCPQVALREAESNGKAYDANQIDLFVLRVVNPQTNVFVFRQKGTTHGNEKEVLFSSGAKLTLRNRILVRNDYKAYKVCKELNVKEKTIPIYILEVDIS
ncbi:MAG: Unknown protein [uncultured Campylobacterales bacterium]|uniref:ADP ribosyltransferase domain-containing protein n=1 Tax=uncultured Campylobacterales bacterium TaxID=352960 RepID=A0A6S6SNU3_9BACT|nr:MAG: Unknown protein [uncultured Campylobacterales bacterium]